MEHDQQYATQHAAVADRPRRARRIAGRIVVAGLLIALGGTVSATASNDPPGDGAGQREPRVEMQTESFSGTGEKGDGHAHALMGGVPSSYSECMREHGIEHFPDPDADGTVRFDGELGSDLDAGSPQHRSAHEACGSELPAPKDGTGDQKLERRFEGPDDGPSFHRSGEPPASEDGASA